MFSKKIKTLLTAILVCVLVIGGVVLADTIVNNYYGNVELQQTAEGDMLGGISSTGGICNGSEPTVELCNVSAYDLKVQNKTEQGGAVTSASSTMTIAFALTAAQVCDSAVITVNDASTITADNHLIAASLDITFPASSTLFADCLTSDGDSTEFVFYNGSPTAATTTQLVAGTGGFLFENDGQNVEIGGLNAVKIKIQRADTFEPNEDYMIFVNENIPG